MEDTPHYNTGASMEMPRYISCKKVWALKIARIEQAPADQDRVHPEGDYVLHFEDPRYAPRIVGADWMQKRGAKPGGYFVMYEDGYPTWSPAEAFEKGCTPEAEWGIPRSQELKYGINMRGKLYNRATGTEVTCPLWVLLAKDTRSMAHLSMYHASVPKEDERTRGAMERVILQFSDWQRHHPDLMKPGDSKAPPPPVPHSIAPQRWSPGERERE